jgi:hypothetical protein
MGRRLFALGALLVLATAGVFTNNGVSAQEEGSAETPADGQEFVEEYEVAPGEFEDEAPQQLGPSEDVFIASVLPQDPTGRTFAAGSVIEVALTFENRGEDAMNITALQASLMYEWQQFIQNVRLFWLLLLGFLYFGSVLLPEAGICGCSWRSILLCVFF